MPPRGRAYTKPAARKRRSAAAPLLVPGARRGEGLVLGAVRGSFHAGRKPLGEGRGWAQQAVERLDAEDLRVWVPAHEQRAVAAAEGAGRVAPDVEDVARAAREWFSDEDAVIVLVGRAAEFRAAMEQMGSVEVVARADLDLDAPRLRAPAP